MVLSNGVQVIPGSVGKSPALPDAFGGTDDRAMTAGRLRPAVRILALILGLATLSIGCSDSPSAPGRQYRIQLRLFVEGLETSAGPALESAFGQVNRVRISLTRASNGTVAASEARSVTPGQDAHGMNVDVTVQGPGRTFDVVVAALEENLLLFQSATIRVSVNANGVSEPDPLDVPLVYKGPGVGATEVKLSHEVLVLEVGSSATLTAQVFQGPGAPVDAVPLAWSTSNPTVATVSLSGELAGITEGYTAVSAVTPTGISDSIWAYVVSGELAFVRAGKIFTGSAGGTEATVVTPQSASARTPAWSGDGSKLFYSDDGVVTLVDSGVLGLAGTWPSLSPDGTKLALERDGRIFFANEDGTNPTP
ncbi:MAG: TolB family protein, partial [Longimicrobiales bacterium]